jgi:hypothetical protein
MQKINHTFKALRRRFIHTYDNTCVGKWSSQKFQDEQINEKFGVAFSDGDICIFCYNINIGNIPSQPY